MYTPSSTAFLRQTRGGVEFVEYDNNAFPYPQTIGSTTNSITGLGPADETMIDTIFIMPNKSTNPDATLMIVVDEVDPPTNPKTYQYVYVGNINDLPSDVLTENSIVDFPGTDQESVMSQKGATDLVSEYNVSSNNSNTEYTFAQAVALVPASLQKGGLTIKYIDSTTHEYVIKRLMSSTWNTTESNWQGIDDEPTAGSNNLVKSQGICFSEALQHLKVFKYSIQTNTWYGDGNRHFVIPVVSGSVISWSGISVMYCAFLTTYDHIPVLNETPSFVTGYESRQSKTSEFTIPEGCNYFIVNNPSYYTSIKVNGVEVIKGLFPAITQKITPDRIADLLTVYQLISNLKSTNDRLNTNDNYLGARLIYELLQSINGGLFANGFFNLFVTKYRGIISPSGDYPTTDNATSIYNTSDYIPVTQGHSYYYELSGSNGVCIIAEYDSSYEFIQGIVGNGGIGKGFFTPSENTAYVACCFNLAYSPNGGAFIDVTDRLYAFKNEIPEDISIETSVISNNIANPANVLYGSLNSDGRFIGGTSTGGYLTEVLEVIPGQVITFGGNDLGRGEYYTFFSEVPTPSAATQPIVNYGGVSQNDYIYGKTVTVPEGAKYLYFMLQFNGSPSSENIVIQANYGNSLLQYDEYQEAIKSINGLPLESTEIPEDLEDRLEALEEQVSEVPSNLIADLPVSDGTGITVGYAYIDSSTGVVKIKMS